MKTKTINFDYNGGSYTQTIAIRGANLPWTSECHEEWVSLENAPTSVTVTVAATYDYRQRECDVTVTDRFGNALCLHVVQHGYGGIRIECPESIVMYDAYYDTSDNYDVYVTVYGGERQEVSCAKLQPYLSKVWDNGGLYNDFKLRIPRELEGSFIVEHMEAKKYRKYCKEHNIEYDNSDIRKVMKIVKIPFKDAVGTMSVLYGGNVYRNGDRVVVEIDSLHKRTVRVLSSEFKRVVSSSKYEVVNNREVAFGPVPSWISFRNENGVVDIIASEPNRLEDRVFSTRLVNTMNPHQFVDVDIVQKAVM